MTSLLRVAPGARRFATRAVLRFAVATAIVASVVPAAAARPMGPPQPVENGSFADGLSGWSAVGSSAPCPWTVIRSLTSDRVCHAGYGFQEPAPVDGSSFASTDFDRPSADAPADTTLSQRLRISSSASVATLRWFDFISWDLVSFGAQAPRVASVEIRDESGTKVLRTLSQQTLLPGTANLDASTWTAHSADVSSFAGCNVTLVFHLAMPEVASGPATYSLDGVAIASSRHVSAAEAAARHHRCR